MTGGAPRRGCNCGNFFEVFILYPSSAQTLQHETRATSITGCIRMFLILSPNILQPTPEKRLDLRFVCRQAARNVRFSRCGFALHRKLSLHKKAFRDNTGCSSRVFALCPRFRWMCSWVLGQDWSRSRGCSRRCNCLLTCLVFVNVPVYLPPGCAPLRALE